MMSRMVRICVQANEKLRVLLKIVFQIRNGLVFSQTKPACVRLSSSYLRARWPRTSGEAFRRLLLNRQRDGKHDIGRRAMGR